MPFLAVLWKPNSVPVTPPVTHTTIKTSLLVSTIPPAPGMMSSPVFGHTRFTGASGQEREGGSESKPAPGDGGAGGAYKLIFPY